ncbi:DNA double-strand break repair nuclease NurA [Candidatus Woesearchaeota archaeon]|nr:DNA double-strand break repair nuclease NurA [Candidatus Woesearchaeota archaeon]
MDRDVIGRILEEAGGLDRPCVAGVEGVAGAAGLLCSYEIDCAPSGFSKDRFHSIPDIGSGDCPRVVFIDGGNAGIFSSPDFCVHFIRIFHTEYEGNRRVSCSADGFYVLCRAEAGALKDGGRIVFSAKMFPSCVKSLTDSFFTERFEFDPLDKSLLEKNSRMAMSRVPGMVRRIAELSTALLLASKAGRGDNIIVDGDFCTRTVYEKKLVDALARFAGRGVSIAGLSKTSDLITSGGCSVTKVLSAAAPAGAWYYSPAAVRKGTAVSFAKLHPESDYIFKLETLAATMPEDVLKVLSANSTDAVFLGYPYGLIEADRFARVSEREKGILRTMFMAKAGKGWESLAGAEKSLDAHSVLDNI